MIYAFSERISIITDGNATSAFIHCRCDWFRKPTYYMYNHEYIIFEGRYTSSHIATENMLMHNGPVFQNKGFNANNQRKPFMLKC